MQLPLLSNACRAEDESIREAPFPLYALLLLYETGSIKDLYCNYFEGFKLLVSWLRPIGTPSFENEISVPKLLSSYELQEIASILGTSQEIVYQTWTLGCNNSHTVAD